MPEIPTIDFLVSNHKAFDAFVYTPVREALCELKKRWEDKSIIIDVDIPLCLKDGFKAIHYVSLVSPNYQIRKYINVAKVSNLEPIILEQRKDKFTSNNEWKHSLGQLRFYSKVNKKGEAIIEHVTIIDFPQYDGKPIPDVLTVWGQSLIGFHHELFFKTFPSLTGNIHDISDWVQKFGDTPREYYSAFLFLLIKHGIQFENFMIDEKELWFTREIFLPAFIEVYRKTGLKPLIVALEPTDIEGEEFWVSYPREEKFLILEKLRLKN